MAKTKPPAAAVKVDPPSPDTWPQWQQSASTYAAGRAAIDTADSLALDAEHTWGCGKLRLLVSQELREKFDSQRMKFNQAIRHGDLEQVRSESARMAKAWTYLDNVARETNCQPLAPEVWEVARDDGRVVAIVKTMQDARHVVHAGRYVEVYDLHEIASLIQGFPTLAKVKQTFPGAEIVAIRPIRDPLEDWEETGDEIPFGVA